VNKLSKISSLSFLLCLMLMTVHFQDVKAQPPDYAKWSRAALSEIMKKYPNSSVTDFKYLGRSNISNTQSKDTFDFMLQKNTEKKVVRADVYFNPQTNQLISIQTKIVP
jgi:hypothetical protein